MWPGEGNGNPFQYSCLGKFHGWRSLGSQRIGHDWATNSFTFSLLLLPLGHFSHVQLCATPETAAHQALPSLGVSRQEHWSGLPFPSPVHEMKSEREFSQSCPTLHDPMDCSPPGSSAHGTFQARVLEWGAIDFSIWLCGSPQIVGNS